MDELDYFVRLHMMQDPSRETVTLRHDRNETLSSHPAIRRIPSRLRRRRHGRTLGSASTRACMPDCFELYSKTVERYGEKKLPEDHSIQDWGITYDEMEPYYARSERKWAFPAKPENNGKKIEGGNIFEGWRSERISQCRRLKTPVFRYAVRRRGEIAGLPSLLNPTAITSRTTRIPTA